ncbi:hypothetical protein PVAND_017222 [Polypedilum vanderplanki]|uniref:Ubiquitin-like domain-containing protein n=1 Tax=Polypedilum vanderplanki TaxID=319348 RepID=A0A9J6BIT3_POLVA|nr:hypothetical protein PVAND_017222 [Polypedilum vanderplanki]
MDAQENNNDVKTTVDEDIVTEEQNDSGIGTDASSVSSDASYQTVLSNTSISLDSMNINSSEEDEKNADAQLDFALEDTLELIIERDDKEIPLNMDKTATISDVLNQASLIGNFTSDDFDLSIDSKTLPRTISLRDAAITYGSRIRLVERPFQIFIRRVDGRILTLDVTSSNTIEYLKERFNYTDQVPIHQQRLLYQSQELENSRTLQFYKIRKNATLEMVYRLRGGF